MDKVSALCLGFPCILSDQDCSVHLPEEEHTFQRQLRNNMPDLQTVRKHALPLHGAFAKLVVVASMIGTLVSLSHDGRLISDNCKASQSDGLDGLRAQINQLGNVLRSHDPSHSSLIKATGKKHNEHHDLSQSSSVQHLYSRALCNLAQMFVNHPFFTRRLVLPESSVCKILQQRNSDCRNHAEELINFVCSSSSLDAVPHNQLFPGYIIFNAGLIHCLFSQSPEEEIASRSRKLYWDARKILCQGAAMSGEETHAQSYLEVLDFFFNNPGNACLIVNPLQAYQSEVKAPTLWRFLDFGWLCENFGINKTSTFAKFQCISTQPVEHQIKTAATNPLNSTETAQSTQLHVAPYDMMSPTTVTPAYLTVAQSLCRDMTVSRSASASIDVSMSPFTPSFAMETYGSGDNSRRIENFVGDSEELVLASQSPTTFELSKEVREGSFPNSTTLRNWQFPVAFPAWDDVIHDKLKSQHDIVASDRFWP